MLRRHLKRGGAPVAACAGFDFDAANAYLENALGGSRRAGYESHLAGCATCRRHLIELSRLAQIAPHVGTQPTVFAHQTPAWVRWREVVVGWFDLPAWNLKWQMVGATGVAFAILIAALGVQSWRQASKPADIAASAPITPATSVDPNTQAFAHEASPAGTPFPGAENPVADRQGLSRPSVPAPPTEVGPKDTERDIAVAPSTESSKLNAPQPVETSSFDFSQRQRADTQRISGAFQQGQGLPQEALTSLAGSSDNAGKKVPTDLRADSREQTPSPSVQAERNEIAARISPPPEINPMNPEPKPTPHNKPQNGKSPAPPKLSGIARTLVPWGKSDPQSESERKVKFETLDDESSKPLKVRIRDKVFRYDSNLKMWIDQEYKDEMLWRVLRLKRGGKEYEQVLASDPLLKEFFDRGPILIVWKHKIYKVR